MSTVSFEATRADIETIKKIVRRAAVMYRSSSGKKLDKVSLQMDITACHANGCPLDLQRLLGADDFNFAHDAFGISRHIDRQTGRMLNCFLPRFSMPSSGGQI